MRRRKRSSSDKFEEVRRASKDAWRELEEALKTIVGEAEKGPLPPEYIAGQVLEMVCTERRVWRRFLRRRFGAQITNIDGNDRVVGINNWPGRDHAEEWKNSEPGEHTDSYAGRLAREWLREEWLLLISLQSHAKWELSYRVMLQRGEKVLDELGGWDWPDDEKRYWVSLGCLQGFVLAQRATGDYIAMTTPPAELPPILREAIGAVLTGQTEAQISLSRNKRLKAAFGEQGKNAWSVLREELPGAVMEEWGFTADKLAFAGKYSELKARVARKLERSGVESSYLARRGKLSASEPGDIAEDTDDLSDFERREEARQRLDSLEKNVRLSTQQAEIWQRLRQGMEIAEIAGDLKIPRSQVSQQKARIKRKMQKVRRAAGF